MTEMTPHPIKTAPINSPIFTNKGIALGFPCYSLRGDLLHVSYYLCLPCGALFFDGGKQHLRVYPNKWTPLPDWVKP
jgi:hypothetical protein